MLRLTTATDLGRLSCQKMRTQGFVATYLAINSNSASFEPQAKDLTQRRKEAAAQKRPAALGLKVQSMNCQRTGAKLGPPREAASGLYTRALKKWLLYEQMGHSWAFQAIV